jgi:LNS2 (Lipin/Ned1/Smp2).
MNKKIYPTGLKQQVVIVDVDGTVALRKDNRGPFDWHLVGTDFPNYPIINVVRALRNEGYNIVFVSGRKEQCRAETIRWIHDYIFPYQIVNLYMREDEDNRPDFVVKKEIFDTYLKDFNILLVIDDRDQVVKMWREELGLICIQVAEGKF